jgi:hypothetical protein
LLDEDAFTAWMEAQLDPDDKAFEKTTDLYGSFSAWCKRSGEPPRSRREFVQAIENRNSFKEARDNTGQRGVKGYRIKVERIDVSDAYREQYQ